MKPISDFLGRRNWPEREDTCPEHGPFIARQTPRGGWTICPTCFEQKQAQEAQESYRQTQRILREYAIKQALGQAALPLRFLDRPLASIVPAFPAQADALQRCRDYVASWPDVRISGRNMLLLGDPGSGKTHLATAVATEVLMAGSTALYTRADSLFQTVRETYSGVVNRSEKQAVESFAIPDLLVIDEFGRSTCTDSERRIFFSVIDQRYEKRLPTLLVSNLSFNALQESLGIAMFSRLLENNSVVFEFHGEDTNVRLARAQ